MRNLLSIAIAASVFLSLQTPASACGGYEFSPLEDVVQWRDLVVAATVDYVDKLGTNFILKVHRYIKGSGGHYLPVVYWRPAVYYADTVRDYDHGCLNVGWGERRFRRGDYGYFALHSNNDGTYDYSRESVWIPGDVDQFDYEGPTDGVVDFYMSSRFPGRVDAPLPISGFEALLLQLSDAVATAEPDGDSYPLMRFLKITTESGKRYRLNPDYSVTWLDPDWWPEAVSNDGSHVMFRQKHDELAFQYLALLRKELWTCSECEHLDYRYVNGGHASSESSFAYDGWLKPVNGWHAQFSPDSNFVAVQNRNELLIYMFDNWTLAVHEYGQVMGMEVVAGQRVWWNISKVEKPPLAWSADSTTIAYQDNRGIWQWDIFEETYPHLVVPGDQEIELLDVSNSGQYLRFSHEDSWSLINVRTGETFERAIATPDERNLIFVRPSHPVGTVTARAGRKNHYRNDWRDCHAPLSKCSIHIVEPLYPIEFFEYQPGWIGLVTRRSVKLLPWYLSMEESRLSTVVEPPLPIEAFDYDELYNLPATAYGDYNIAFGFTTDLGQGQEEIGRYAPVDLRSQLDSPIVDIEWGQPVFLELQ